MSGEPSHYETCSPGISTGGGLRQLNGSPGWTAALPPACPSKPLPPAPSGTSSVMSDKIMAWADENDQSSQAVLNDVEVMFALEDGLAARRQEALTATVTRTIDGGSDKTKLKELSQIAKVARRCLKQLDEREQHIKERVLLTMRQLAQQAHAAGHAAGASRTSPKIHLGARLVPSLERSCIVRHRGCLLTDSLLTLIFNVQVRRSRTQV